MKAKVKHHPGTKYLYNTQKYPYLKDSYIRVIKKHGRGYLCTTFDGVLFGTDWFESYELDRMTPVVNPL